MKLLFDQNLSHRLVSALADIFPQSEHVRFAGLHQASDAVIWEFAQKREFIIVSKDDDFHQRSFLYGYPPKVIWLRLGNCTTSQIAECLRRHPADVITFSQDQQAAFMSLG